MSSSSSTITASDPEVQQTKVPHSHFAIVFQPHGVSPEVIAHKYPGSGTAEDPYVVDFLPVDPHNPMTFSFARKWLITGLAALATFAVAFDSSAYSGGVVQIMMAFHVSKEIAILGVSLFVLGFAIGPLIWAPLSELYGRQIIFFITYFALTAFLGGSVASQNMETLVILRCIAGCFGASTLTNSGGVIADLFSANERGAAGALFALAPFLGPALGPISGGFLGQYEGWRWVEGLMTIFTAFIWIVVSLVVPETYAPVLLRKRAAKLQEVTGNHYISRIDKIRLRKTIAEEFKIALSRPWILLFREPIVTLTSIYIAIIYGTLYMLFAAYPIVFQLHKHWTQGISGLAFLGVMVGMILGACYCLHDNKRYLGIVKAKGIARPEDRLPPAIIGSVLIPVGMFWFAWTNYNSIHWVVPIIGGGFFACGLVMVFLSLLNYLIDSYVIFAASVLAANSVLRSLFGTAFPLFTTQMYDRLGIHWASSIPAFLALACMPAPYLFYLHGEKIRLACKYSAEADAVLKRMLAGAAEPTEEEAAAEADREEKIRNSLHQNRSRTSSLLSKLHSHEKKQEGETVKKDNGEEIGESSIE